MDILAVLYADILHGNPNQPDLEDRDRLVLSKGHAGAALYAVLAECGYFEVDLLDRHCQDGSPLCGHVAIGLPGVEVSTGSLGHGLPIATGMALGAALRGESWRCVVVMSDGECDEGSVWEAALFAAHHHLGNLLVVIDYNGLQSLGTVEETLGLEPFADKWKAFGWDVAEVDGHDHDALRGAMGPREVGRPRCVLAHTIKGKGVSFMEHQVLWHYRTPQGDELEAAILELESS